MLCSAPEYYRLIGLRPEKTTMTSLLWVLGVAVRA